MSQNAASTYDLFAGEGEMRALMRAHDWAASPLGSPAGWPLEMRAIVSTMLHSKFPMFIAWGPQLGFLYNDAYASVLGAKHPQALGRPFNEVWAEIWHIVGPLCERAFAGEASFFEDMPLRMLRNGHEEQTWFTFSYSPVYDQHGQVSGVFCACTETTENVVNQKRQAFLIELEDRLRCLSDANDIMRTGAEMLGLHLAAGRTGYVEVEADKNSFLYQCVWTDGHSADLSGKRSRLSDYDPFVQELRAGRSVCFNDAWDSIDSADAAAVAPYVAAEVRACIAVPLIKNGNFKSILFVHSKAPRRWHHGEQMFVRVVAERTWNAIERARADQLLQESEQHFRNMADYAPVMIWTTDANGYCTYLNKKWYEFTGQSKSQGLGYGWLDAIQVEDRVMAEQAFVAANRTRSDFKAEYRLQAGDGGMRWVIDTAEPRFDATGAYLGYVGAVIDIHERKLAEAALFASNSRFRAAIDAVEGVIWTNDANGYMIGEQRGWSALTGQNPQQYHGYGWANALHPDDIEHTLEGWQHAVAARKPFVCEHRVRRADGQWRRYAVRAIPTLSPGGEVVEWVGVHTDITERHESEEHIQHLATHDALTGLTNRRMFNAQLESAVEEARQNHGTVHVLYIDIDRFKEINDTLGHYVGDILLTALARRLQSHVRKSDFVARLSGDEFGIICKNHQCITELASTLIYELSRPFSLEDHYVVTSVSIGITSFPEDSHHSSQLLVNADMAMYRAKNSGRSAFQFYSSDLEQVAKRRQTIKVGLQRAMANDELQMHYQPMFSVDSNQLCGIEALLRWPLTDIPYISTAELVAVAEDSGVIINMGEWILRTACKQAKALQQQGYFVPVAVNVSSRQLQAPKFIALIEQILDEYQLEPRYLDIEITERVLMENSASNRDTIKTLKDKGIQISVDDFGTGFSSLSYLKNFSVTSLKIDQTFIRGLPYDKEDGAITTAIISLARGLGIKVVAEGIENQAQLEFLKQLDCHRGQGYHLAHPASIDDLITGLSSGKWQHAGKPELH